MTAASLSSETHLHIANKLILSNINAAKLRLFTLTYKKKINWPRWCRRIILPLRSGGRRIRGSVIFGYIGSLKTA